MTSTDLAEWFEGVLHSIPEGWIKTAVAAAVAVFLIHGAMDFFFG